MNWMIGTIVSLLTIIFPIHPASAATQVVDIACETTSTTGTGTLTLSGAKSGGYLSFAAAGVTNGNTVPYSLVNGTGTDRKVETGFGVFTSPSTLTRVATLSSDGAGNELNLSGDSTVCVSPVAGWFTLGAGSTLDADKLDGLSSADFLTQAAADLLYQPLDSDLTSWAGVTRASGFDTFAATPSMANLGSLLTDDASGWTTFGTTPSSANLRSLVTDETGSSGGLVFAGGPTFTAGTLLSASNPYFGFIDTDTGADNFFGGNFSDGSFGIWADYNNEVASSKLCISIDASADCNNYVFTTTTLRPAANDGATLGVSGTAWADMWLASGGLIEWDGGTSNTMTCTSGSCTIEGNTMYRAGGTDVAVADGGTGASSLNDLIALGTHTTGVYVAQVADGTGVDGTCNAEDCTYTPTLDLTEITPGTGLDTGATSIDLDLTELNTVTFGNGTFTALTFDAGATDPVFTFGSNTLTVTNMATMTLPGTLDLGANASATLSTSSANLLVEGTIVKKVGTQTMWIPSGAMTPRTTNGCARGTRETNSITISVLQCDTSTDEAAQFTVTMPKSWDEGTITFAPYWTAASGSGTVDWELNCAALSNDDAITSATLGTAQASNDTLIAANDVHVGPESSAITVGGTPAEGDMLVCQVLRDVSDDTLGVDAELLGIRILYTDNAANDG